MLSDQLGGFPTPASQTEPGPVERWEMLEIGFRMQPVFVHACPQKTDYPGHFGKGRIWIPEGGSCPFCAYKVGHRPKEEEPKPKETEPSPGLRGPWTFDGELASARLEIQSIKKSWNEAANECARLGLDNSRLTTELIECKKKAQNPFWTDIEKEKHRKELELARKDRDGWRKEYEILLDEHKFEVARCQASKKHAAQWKAVADKRSEENIQLCGLMRSVGFEPERLASGTVCIKDHNERNPMKSESTKRSLFRRFLSLSRKLAVLATVFWMGWTHMAGPVNLALDVGTGIRDWYRSEGYSDFEHAFVCAGCGERGWEFDGNNVAGPSQQRVCGKCGSAEYRRVIGRTVTTGIFPFSTDRFEELHDTFTIPLLPAPSIATGEAVRR